MSLSWLLCPNHVQLWQVLFSLLLRFLPPCIPPSPHTHHTNTSKTHIHTHTYTVVYTGRCGVWKRNQQNAAVSECTAIIPPPCSFCVHNKTINRIWDRVYYALLVLVFGNYCQLLYRYMYLFGSVYLHYGDTLYFKIVICTCICRQLTSPVCMFSTAHSFLLDYMCIMDEWVQFFG